MTDRQRRLIGMLLLVVGIGVASTQALLTSCSADAHADAGSQVQALTPAASR